MELGNENLSALIGGLRELNYGSGTAIDYVMLQEFWRQMLAIILTLHSHSIVHMDFKPDNLILFGTTLKIGDLGISRKVHVYG
jgi:serine/threonine protein kinase